MALPTLLKRGILVLTEVRAQKQETQIKWESLGESLGRDTSPVILVGRFVLCYPCNTSPMTQVNKLHHTHSHALLRTTLETLLD